MSDLMSHLLASKHVLLFIPFHFFPSTSFSFPLLPCLSLYLLFLPSTSFILLYFLFPLYLLFIPSASFSFPLLPPLHALLSPFLLLLSPDGWMDGLNSFMPLARRTDHPLSSRIRIFVSHSSN